MASMAAAYKNLSACSVVLNNIDAMTRKTSAVFASGSNATVMKQTVVAEQSDQSDDDESEGEMFEIEESEAPHVPLYHLRDEGLVKWALLTDLCMLLKVKSKDTLLKQVNTIYSLILNSFVFNLPFSQFHRSALRVQSAATTIASCSANSKWSTSSNGPRASSCCAPVRSSTSIRPKWCW